MAQKLDIIAPSAPHGSSALTLHRWLKNIGEVMLVNEPIAELAGSHMMIYVHAPAEGTLSTVLVQPGQNILSGAMLGQVTVVSRNEIEWGNFDTVTDILEDFADKTSNAKEMKDANEALGQLLGVGDNPVFQTMSIEQQNKFIQGVVDEHHSQGISPAQVAQKLLVGMQLRTAPAAGPSGPAFGFGLRGPAGPAPGGMGGMGGGVNYAGITPQQQQGYAPYPSTPAPGQWPAPPQYGHGYPSHQPMHGQGYPIMPQQGQGYPPHGVPQQPPATPVLPVPSEEDPKE
jgi:pyruvate/2-oxoglutarate dehydrogenase complex dihydrolipoamide acyltransferase (E2) component